MVFLNNDENKDIINELESYLRHTRANDIYNAAKYGRVSILENYLKQHNNPNVPYSIKEIPKSYIFTLLGTACEHSQKEVVKLLISAGANVNLPSFIKDMNGKLKALTPLEIAARKGTSDACEIARCLIKHNAGVDYNTCAYSREPVSGPVSALQYAALSHCREMVDILLEAGADVERRDYAGQTALHYSASVGDVWSVRRLLDAGALFDERTKNGKTPLFVAVENGRTNAAVFFLENGADRFCTDEEGYGLMHEAAKSGIPAMINVMVSYDFDANEQDIYNGLTPLHIAASSGNTAIMERLIANGAFIDVFDRIHGNTGGRTPLHYAAMSGTAQACLLLMQNGTSPNILDASRATPLHYAAEHGNYQSVEILAARMADLNAVDFEGNTPAHRAANKNDRVMLGLLYQLGADLQAKNNDGKTPRELLDIQQEKEKKFHSRNTREWKLSVKNERGLEGQREFDDFGKFSFFNP